VASGELTLLDELTAKRSDDQRHRYERSLSSGPEDEFLGVRMGDAFALAKDFRDLPLDEIERLLEQLYLRRANRIDGWDLVDRGCVHVVGGYLFDKSRQPLYRLARSSNPWERRTAIVSTLYFVRRDDARTRMASRPSCGANHTTSCRRQPAESCARPGRGTPRASCCSSRSTPPRCRASCSATPSSASSRSSAPTSGNGSPTGFHDP
jgi:hypothetical protein